MSCIDEAVQHKLSYLKLYYCGCWVFNDVVVRHVVVRHVVYEVIHDGINHVSRHLLRHMLIFT